VRWIRCDLAPRVDEQPQKSDAAGRRRRRARQAPRIALLVGPQGGAPFVAMMKASDPRQRENMAGVV
jgi:hypothetical protein